jgi:hypothetical protein
MKNSFCNLNSCLSHTTHNTLSALPHEKAFGEKQREIEERNKYDAFKRTYQSHRCASA